MMGLCYKRPFFVLFCLICITPYFAQGCVPKQQEGYKQISTSVEIGTSTFAYDRVEKVLKTLNAMSKDTMFALTTLTALCHGYRIKTSHFQEAKKFLDNYGLLSIEGRVYSDVAVIVEAMTELRVCHGGSSVVHVMSMEEALMKGKLEIQ